MAVDFSHRHCQRSLLYTLQRMSAQQGRSDCVMGRISMGGSFRDGGLRVIPLYTGGKHA